MDRRTLLALFNLGRPPTAVATLAAKAAEPSPDAVYAAARALRRRIDVALAASRADPPSSGPRD